MICLPRPTPQVESALPQTRQPHGSAKRRPQESQRLAGHLLRSRSPSRSCEANIVPTDRVGGVGSMTSRFSGACAAPAHVAGYDLMGDLTLAAEPMARCRLMLPGVCRRWLPVWLPNLVSAANGR